MVELTIGKLDIVDDLEPPIDNPRLMVVRWQYDTSDCQMADWQRFMCPLNPAQTNGTMMSLQN